MTGNLERQNIIAMYKEAVKDGASPHKVCEELGLHLRTINRWLADENGTDKRPGAKRPPSKLAFSEEEKKRIIDVCCSAEFSSLPPRQIVAILADRGEYIGSARTIYRVLKALKMNKHRGRARAAVKRQKPTTFTANQINQIWVWDITWIPSTVRGEFFKLYMIMDLFSRDLVAWDILEEENAENSKALLQKAYTNEKIALSTQRPVLHGDNGKPLKNASLIALMQHLGIQPSYSRPRVSNDNAHAEAFFRTLKYAPSFEANGFENIESARLWAQKFINWYKYDHRHSALNYVTPHQKHTGQDVEILKKREQTILDAKELHPERWIGDKVLNCDPVTSTTLNPIDSRKLEKIAKITG